MPVPVRDFGRGGDGAEIPEGATEPGSTAESLTADDDVRGGNRWGGRLGRSPPTAERPWASGSWSGRGVRAPAGADVGGTGGRGWSGGSAPDFTDGAPWLTVLARIVGGPAAVLDWGFFMLVEGNFKALGEGLGWLRVIFCLKGLAVGGGVSSFGVTGKLCVLEEEVSSL